MNNILLKVINDNFSTLRFTSVLKVVLHCFAFCVHCLLGGHHPPECKDAHELRITIRSVSSEMLTIASHMACFSAFKSTGRLLYTSLFKQLHTHTHTQKKKRGAVRSGERGDHGTSPKREITRCGNKR